MYHELTIIESNLSDKYFIARTGMSADYVIVSDTWQLKTVKKTDAAKIIPELPRNVK